MMMMGEMEVVGMIINFEEGGYLSAVLRFEARSFGGWVFMYGDGSQIKERVLRVFWETPTMRLYSYLYELVSGDR